MNNPEQTAEPRWVSVSEKHLLPKKGEHVIVVCVKEEDGKDRQFVDVDTFHGNSFGADDCEGEKVTHFLSVKLPKLPPMPEVSPVVAKLKALKRKHPLESHVIQECIEIISKYDLKEGIE
jgi:hypothetical protein